ncbi:MAG: RNA methyltransferase [Bacteroidia bacterium]
MQKIKNEELERKSVDEFKEAQKTPIIVVLDNVRSALNVGSIFRTADAFIIEAIYLCGITATPPNKEIQKSALGATDTVAWKYFENTMMAIDELKKSGFKIASVEQARGSVMLNDFNPKADEKIALVFGHEVEGVKQEVVNASDLCLEIPQHGHKHSLNISVCSGVVIWDLFCKMILAK